MEREKYYIPTERELLQGIVNEQEIFDGTVKRDGYRLNPHFSRWLMGFPPEWCDCAVTAMQSFPKSRRRS